MRRISRSGARVDIDALAILKSKKPKLVYGRKRRRRERYPLIGGPLFRNLDEKLKDLLRRRYGKKYTYGSEAEVFIDKKRGYVTKLIQSFRPPEYVLSRLLYFMALKDFVPKTYFILPVEFQVPRHTHWTKEPGFVVIQKYIDGKKVTLPHWYLEEYISKMKRAEKLTKILDIFRDIHEENIRIKDNEGGKPYIIDAVINEHKTCIKRCSFEKILRAGPIGKVPEDYVFPKVFRKILLKMEKDSKKIDAIIDSKVGDSINTLCKEIHPKIIPHSAWLEKYFGRRK